VDVKVAVVFWQGFDIPVECQKSTRDVLDGDGWHVLGLSEVCVLCHCHRVLICLHVVFGHRLPV
jgi:hypothetical protein